MGVQGPQETSEYREGQPRQAAASFDTQGQGLSHLSTPRLDRRAVTKEEHPNPSKARLYQAFAHALETLWLSMEEKFRAYEQGPSERAEIQQALFASSSWQKAVRHQLRAYFAPLQHERSCKHLQESHWIDRLEGMKSEKSNMPRPNLFEVLLNGVYHIEDMCLASLLDPATREKMEFPRLEEIYRETKEFSNFVTSQRGEKKLLPAEGFVGAESALTDAFRIQGTNALRVVGDALFIAFHRYHLGTGEISTIKDIIRSASESYGKRMATLHLQVFNQIMTPVENPSPEDPYKAQDTLGLTGEELRPYGIFAAVNPDFFLSSTGRPVEPVEVRRRPCHPIENVRGGGEELYATIGCPAFLARIDGVPVSTLLMRRLGSIWCEVIERGFHLNAGGQEF